MAAVYTASVTKAVKKLRVVSYNIHKGFSVGNRRFVLDNIREGIRSVGADMVFLQEVLGKHDKHEKRVEGWPSSSQFEYLADEVWQHYAYGKNAVYSKGHHGNAILSHFPFSSWENIDISKSPFAKRGLLHGVCSIPGWQQPLHAICLHLDLLKADQMAQAGLLAERINEHVSLDCPLIIAGDFNDWGENVSRFLERELELTEAFRQTGGRLARTFPAHMPTLKLDRIYCRGFHVVRAKRLKGAPWKNLSDHLALYAELSPESEVFEKIKA